jgi:hypothetical protein
MTCAERICAPGTFAEHGATQVRTFDISRGALGSCAAAAMLAGCGGSSPPISAPGAMPPRTATIPFSASQSNRKPPMPMTRTAHVLLIGEQGASFKTGIIAVYTAPFDGKPQILHVNSPIGMTVAPNGALIAADAYNGIWVFDAPWRHKRLLLKVPYPSGQFLFDSQQRLIVPYRGSVVYVFDPPYTKRAALSFGVPAEIQEVAIDSHDSVFVGTQATSGGPPTFECKPPSYYPCARLSIGSGAAATNSSDDLLTGISAERFAEFPPPYKHAKVKAKVSFPFYWLTTANSDATFVAGVDAEGNNYLGAFPSTITKPLVQLPVEQYFIPGLQYAVGKNRELSISDGTFQQPYVSMYAYPYLSKARQRMRVKYPIMSVFAQ